MADDEFAPVTPGEMLKEEFLAEYRAMAKTSLPRAIGISPTGRRNRQQPPPHHCGYRPAPKSLLRQQSRVLDEPAGSLRPEAGPGQT